MLRRPGVSERLAWVSLESLCPVLAPFKCIALAARTHDSAVLCWHVLCCVQDELAEMTEKLVKHMHGHSGSITGLSYSTDQELLFSSSADGTVRLWSC